METAPMRVDMGQTRKLPEAQSLTMGTIALATMAYGTLEVEALKMK